MKAVADLVEAAKRAPGKLSYGSAGYGTPGHLTGEMLCQAAGIKLQHVPYKGSAPALTDLLGGRTQLMFDPLQSVLSHVQSGSLRAIALSSRDRVPILPAVATITESGYPEFETTAWWGLFAPAKLPDAVAATLAAAIEEIVRSESFRSRLEPLGAVPTVLSRGAFAAFQAGELAKWGKAVRDSGATME